MRKEERRRPRRRGDMSPSGSWEKPEIHWPWKKDEKEKPHQKVQRVDKKKMAQHAQEVQKAKEEAQRLEDQKEKQQREEELLALQQETAPAPKEGEEKQEAAPVPQPEQALPSRQETGLVVAEPKKHRLIAWLKDKKNRKKAIFGGALAVVLCVLGVMFLPLLLGGHSELSFRLAAEDGYTRRNHCYNFMVGALDESGKQVDGLLLVTMDTDQKKVNILQIPHNTVVDTARTDKRLLAAYGDGGAQQLKTEVQELLAVPIDKYGIVNIAAFSRLVDELGGVEVNIPQKMSYQDPSQNLNIALNAGVQTLNGEQSSQLVRYRSGYADTDSGRQKTQKAFMAMAIRSWMNVGFGTRAAALAQIAKEQVETDLEESDIAFLLDKLQGLQEADIRFLSLPGELDREVAGGEYHVYEQETVELINIYFNPYEQQLGPEEFHVPSYERKYNNNVDITGQSLSDAVNIQLSIITGEARAENQTLNPNSAEELAKQQEEANNAGVGDLNSGTDSSSTMVKSEDGTMVMEVEGEEKKEEGSGLFSKVRVEIINSTKDKNILNEVAQQVQQKGFQVVRVDTANNITNPETMIINRNDKRQGKNLTGLFADVILKDDYQDSNVDVTIIIGNDLLK